MIEGHARRWLIASTAGLLLMLTVLQFTGALRTETWRDQATEAGAQRNERSTPRSFILPATPAVAIEQEQQAREMLDGIDTFGCLHRLRALGYEADASPPALRARNLEAIFRFQKDRGMAPTGRLDRSTVKLLGCQ
jgi:hypothetical protein